jgi:HAD superfamily hydrolase (TIGR01509 family)
VRRDQSDGLGAATGFGSQAAYSIGAWLFDFDNTLAALEQKVNWAASRIELEAFLRARRIPSAVFRAFPKRNLVLYEAVRADLQTSAADRDSGVIELLRGASEIIERHELAGVASTPPLRGAIELLTELHARNTPCAIVTSNSSRTVRSWLTRYHLQATVKVVVGRDSMMALKPDPSMLSRALAELQVSTEDAIFVGDSKADLSAARSLGVRFAAIGAKHRAREAIREAGADAIFNTPAELGAYFGVLGAPAQALRR